MKFKPINRYLIILIFFAIQILFFQQINKALAVNEVNWASFKQEMTDSAYVKDVNKCLECHEDYMKAFDKTLHGRVFKTGAKNELESRYCEACHGPLSKHLGAKRNKQYVVSLKSDTTLTPQQRNSICLQCHEKTLRMYWQGSAHETAGVVCSNCHYVSERRSATRLFIKEDPKGACFQCHKEYRAQLQRSSHMPLREGKLECANCHNPHGGPGPKLLKKASVNETCYQCHTEKRGPMLWEHPPVRENCVNCHEPHGSNYQNLLKAKPPYLCQQCHSRTGHISTMYEGTRIPGGGGGNAQQLIGKGCINCHTNIHGSNHPSGSRFQR